MQNNITKNNKLKQGVIEWFAEPENDANRTLWPTQLPDLIPAEHLQEILDWPPPTSTQNIF